MGILAGRTKTLVGQRYKIGEKTTAILYTYINRHDDAGTPEKQRQKHTMDLNIAQLCYIGFGIGFRYIELESVDCRTYTTYSR